MIKQPILITGLPRSGTTWIGEILSSDTELRYYYEPDNEKINSYACYYKRSVHRFPFRLNGNVQDDYFQLWESVFFGYPYKKINTLLFKTIYNSKVSAIESSIGDKVGYIYTDTEMKNVSENTWEAPFVSDQHPFLSLISRFVMHKRPILPKKRILVKSVHTPLCLEWMDKCFGPQIVVVLRNPFALYASYKRLFMPDAYRNILLQKELQPYLNDTLGIPYLSVKSFNEEVIVQILLVYKILSNQLKANDHWHFISHDRLCFNPIGQFQNLYDHLDMNLTDMVKEKLHSLNTSGDGFDPKRVSKDQPMKWKKELSDNEINLIEYWMTELDVRGFIEEYIYDDS